jgi:hypothetical protein
MVLEWFLTDSQSSLCKMPFVSRQQQRWGHTEAGQKALGGPAAVKEWDSVTPKKLPTKVHHPGVKIK